MGLFPFKRIPFCPCGTSSTFQRLMNIVMRGLLYVATYQDDLHSKYWEVPSVDHFEIPNTTHALPMQGKMPQRDDNRELPDQLQDPVNIQACQGGILTKKDAHLKAMAQAAAQNELQTEGDECRGADITPGDNGRHGLHVCTRHMHDNIEHSRTIINICVHFTKTEQYMQLLLSTDLSHCDSTYTCIQVRVCYVRLITTIAWIKNQLLSIHYI